MTYVMNMEFMSLMKQTWKHMERGLNSLTKNISFQMMIQNGWKMY